MDDKWQRMYYTYDTVNGKWTKKNIFIDPQGM